MPTGSATVHFVGRNRSFDKFNHRVAPFLIAGGLLGCPVHLATLKSQSHNRGSELAKSRKGRIRGTLSNDALAAIGACSVLVVVLALTMRDKKPRFHFDSFTGAAPVASASPATAAASPLPTPAASPDVQALFVQGRAESPLIAPVETPISPPFVPGANIDYAKPPVFREIQEAELGQVYASAPKRDKRALVKVARLGGFGSPEAMARAFGYPSVEQMLSIWDRTAETPPQFRAANFGTNAKPPLPWQD